MTCLRKSFMFAVCLADTERDRIPRGIANGSRDCRCDPIYDSRAGRGDTWQVLCKWCLHVPKFNGAKLTPWMLYKQRSKYARRNKIEREGCVN